MSRRKLYRIIIEAAAGILLIFVLVFFLGFRVTGVQVEGNSFYTDDQIKNMILDVPMAKNSILAGFIDTEKSTKDEAMIDSITVSRVNRNTLLLQVKEKQMIGYIEFQGQCVNFDRQGIVQIITEEPLENVPKIEGIDVKEAVQGERLSGINTTKLNTILSVGKMLEKMEEKPDRLVFNDLNQLVLYYGTIEVRLGDDENMDEKINRLVGILPELEGMSGILHLENTTEDSESVVFDDATQEEDQEDTQESGSSQTIQEDTGQKDTDKDQLDYSDGSDSADTRSMEEQ
ncbi:MAG TPA: cell division protein FtsQ/DivIB [Candidatus Blautia stercorigallinarum]|uniref:Cell division protein FtsQ/DivIB n=1 Tax=Candidatus Blautia stercorigallinarum TaxID=2838501 RepID=A0A9D1PAP9_9FIRM|nr:cell division protein FtsQ/DivIB [Candidatus Blautia stercorigallinarum]